jgi:L-ascorbate metabolism protein UlaG (beta-lactamase superfamily)
MNLASTAIVFGVAALLLLPAPNMHAQASAPTARPYLSSPRRALTAPELRDAPDEWIDRSLQWVEDVLREHPPQVEEEPVRRAALTRLDDILHIESAPAKPLVQAFYRRRMEQAVHEIETTRTAAGMQIWKLYNHGWFVRTPSVAFAFDIVPGASVPGFAVDRAVLERLAAQADALFITHAHDDHASAVVARLFIDRGKPVVGPEGLWAGTGQARGILFPKRGVGPLAVLPVQGGRTQLRFVAYPGHQDQTRVNNVYLVTTPEGMTVVQTGDQWGDEGPGGDFDWLTQIGRDHRVDVLLPNCWANGLQRMIRGIDPRLVLPGHENEMGHTVDHREDYTQTYAHLFGSRYPFIVMAWGEMVRLAKP